MRRLVLAHLPVAGFEPGELIQRFIDQQVLPVVQPEFISSLGTAYELGLGPARAAKLNPNASGTVYDAFRSSPLGLGFIIPPRWLLGLPSWAKAPLK